MVEETNHRDEWAEARLQRWTEYMLTHEPPAGEVMQKTFDLVVAQHRAALDKLAETD